MPLNKNNFLRWDGVFKPIAFTLNSDPVLDVTLFAGEDTTTCTPLALPIVSNGIDLTSFYISDVINFTGGVLGTTIALASPPQYDSTTGILTVGRPLDPTVTAYQILFYFEDVLQNKSALCRQVVNVSTVYTTWIPYPVSVVCVLDNFGNNTGYKSWGQLILTNMATGTPIIPLTLKDNQEGDPDYYRPIQDFTLCPPAGSGSGLYAPLIIGNYSRNGGDPTNYITITNIFLSSSTLGAGGSPLTLNIPCNIPYGTATRFIIPSTSTGFTYDGGLSISYVVTGTMIPPATPLRNWLQNTGGAVTAAGGGGIGTVVVDNSGILALSGFSISNPNGTTIYAQ